MFKKFIEGYLSDELLRMAWISAIRRTTNSDNIHKIYSFFVGNIGEIVIANIFPMCQFSLRDKCIGCKTDGGHDLDINLKNRHITMDIKTVLDEDYRISSSHNNVSDLSDFLILVFVDLISREFRIRGFTSKENFAKLSIKVDDIYFLHKEYMSNFYELYWLIMKSIATEVENEERFDAAMLTKIDNAFMSKIRNSVMGTPNKDRVGKEWENITRVRR